MLGRDGPIVRLTKCSKTQRREGRRNEWLGPEHTLKDITSGLIATNILCKEITRGYFLRRQAYLVLGPSEANKRLAALTIISERREQWRKKTAGGRGVSTFARSSESASPLGAAETSAPRLARRYDDLEERNGRREGTRSRGMGWAGFSSLVPIESRQCGGR